MYLNCPVCWSSIRPGLGAARLLAMRTCGHVVCTDCIVQIRAQSAYTTCHTCRKHFRANDLVVVQLKWGIKAYNPVLFGNLVRAKDKQCVEDNLSIQEDLERVDAMKRDIFEQNLTQSELIEAHQAMLRNLRRRAKLLQDNTAEVLGDARNELARIAAATESAQALTSVDTTPSTDEHDKNGDSSSMSSAAAPSSNAGQLVGIFICFLAWLVARAYVYKSRVVSPSGEEGPYQV